MKTMTLTVSPKVAKMLKTRKLAESQIKGTWAYEQRRAAVAKSLGVKIK